jgi:hypothetical protein
MSVVQIRQGRTEEPEALLALAMSQPPKGLTAALATLAADPPPRVASIAHQAAGIALRDYGDISEAINHLRSAMRFARLAGDAVQEADVRGSLGVARRTPTRSGLNRITMSFHAACSPLPAAVTSAVMENSSSAMLWPFAAPLNATGAPL